MRTRAGPYAIALIALACLAGLLPVAWLGVGDGGKALDAYALRVISFTLWQALLSTLLSAVLGAAAALALVRRSFWGRTLLVRLLALPIVMPALVVVLGIITIFGAEGFLSGFVPVYGLTGILLAHVFFNAPLVARLTLSALATIPEEQLRLAAQLGFSDRAHFIRVDWPVLRRSLPGTLFLVFLLCASSFTIVLTLGGGPQATTLEVAIYQALRFDFDPARATLLALVQIALCGVLGLGVLHFAQRTEPQFRLRINRRRHDGHTPLSRMIDVGAMLLMVALLVPPLAALLVSGVSALHVQAGFVRALTTSLLFGLATSLLSGALAWMLASWAARSAGGARLSTLVSQAGLVLPPAVIATGWFILATRGPGLAAFALPLIIALNCLMALPFAYGALAPALRGTLETHDRLCGSLGISGWNRLRFIDLPAMTSPLSLALAMAALVSLGDLSAILFFGDGRYVTLPALIYQQMGSYRMEGAMGTALVLALLSLAVLWAAESWSRRHA